MLFEKGKLAQKEERNLQDLANLISGKWVANRKKGRK